MCEDKIIKELLPAHHEQILDPADRLRVDRHLTECEDCRSELALLALMAEDAVPDPGEAFWATMPQRVARRLRLDQDQKPTLAGRMPDLFLPARWAWGTAALAVVAVTTWLIVWPRPLDHEPRQPTALSAASVAEDVSSEPINVAGLSSSELESIDLWAEQELAVVQREINEVALSDLRNTVEQEIYELQKDELDRLFKLLENRSQEVPS